MSNWGGVVILCFNPYFSGSVTGTKQEQAARDAETWVSILILVDQSLEPWVF